MESLLNAMSQEYDGCNLIGEYPLGQILIDEWQGDKSHSVQEQRVTVTEIIEKTNQKRMNTRSIN